MDGKRECLVILITAALIILGAVFYFVFREEEISPLEEPREDIVRKQMRELDELRAKTNPEPVTQELIDRQIDELNKLRAQAQNQ